MIVISNFLNAQEPDMTIIPECRAVWYNVYRIAIDDEEAAKREIDNHFVQMNSMGINTVFFLVKFPDGEVFYDSKICPRRATWDCLKYIIKKCREYKIEIHPYINVYAETGYYLKTHPEYADINSSGKTSTWSNPAVEEVSQHAIDIIKEIITNYEVDGIQLDRVRYDNTSMGYNPESIRKYKALCNKDPDVNDPDWKQFRKDLVSDFVARVYKEVKAINKGLKVSAAVFHSPKTSMNVLQDWPRWVKDGTLDFVCTMSYTASTTTFTTYVDDSVAAVKNKMPLYIGIGAYYTGMTADILDKQIDIVRSRDLKGMVFFSAYDLFNPEYTKILTAKYSTKSVIPHSIPRAKDFEDIDKK